jgi:hypothetical protein
MDSTFTSLHRNVVLLDLVDDTWAADYLSDDGAPLARPRSATCARAWELSSSCELEKPLRVHPPAISQHSIPRANVPSVTLCSMVWHADIDVPHCIGNDESDDLNGAPLPCLPLRASGRLVAMLPRTDTPASPARALVAARARTVTQPQSARHASPDVRFTLGACAADQEQDEEKWTEMGLGVEFQL